MKNRFLILSVAYLFSFMLEAASFDPVVFGPYEVGELRVQAKILSPTDSLEEEVNGMQDIFSKLYEPYTPETLYGDGITEKLGGASVAKAAAMKSSAQADKDLLGKPGIIHVRLETVEGSFLGYLSIQDWDIDTAEKPEGIPEKSIYIRRFYFLPEFQGKGIGKFVMSNFLRRLRPEARHVYLSTLRINKGAIAFYEKLGFRERAKGLFDLPIENYISYELHLGA